MHIWKRIKAAIPRLWGGVPSPYEASAVTRRTTGWVVSGGDVNTSIFGSLDSLRSKSRDIVRKNPWAANALDSFVANCIGTGITPRSKHSNPQVREQIQKLWSRWTDQADANGLTDFYGLQSLACRSTMESGECIVRLRPRLPQDGLWVPLQLQLLESEHLPLTKTELGKNGNYIRSGIEFNGIGKRVAYHLHREHPGDSMNPMASLEIVRVPADSVLHLYRPLRPGQLRGQPWLAQVLIKLHELDHYDDAELVRKKTAAMFAGFILKNSPEDQLLAGEEADEDEADVSIAGLEPGTMQVLLPGEDVKFSSPADVGAAYETFMRVQLRSIAAGMGITYEQLTGDLTGVNYSSIRAGLIEFRRRCEQFQHQTMVFQLCRPVWQAWIQAAILSGALAVDPNDPEIYDLDWIPQGWPWVDPLKDVQGKLSEVRSGFLSRTKVVSEQGYDAEEMDREIAADNTRADSLKLAFESDPRQDKVASANAEKRAALIAADQGNQQ